MRKELLLAIIAGSSLGLLIAFGVWRANAAIQKNTSGTIPNTNTASQQAQTNSQNLAIISPQDKNVFTQDSTTIQGIAHPNSIIAISGESTDYLTFADQSGSFTQNVDLVGGVNSVQITQIDSDFSKSSGVNLNLVYTSQMPQSPNVNQSEVQASDSVRQKIQEKLDQAVSKPIFEMGVVTDKTDTSLQIRLADGQIQQVTLDPTNTTFVRISKTTKETDFSDLGIGDFIAAAGWDLGSGLNGARIIIQDSPNSTSRKVFWGKVRSANTKTVTIDASNGQVNINSTDKPLIYYKNSDNSLRKTLFTFFDEQDQIVALGDMNGDNFSARTVFDLTITTPTPKP